VTSREGRTVIFVSHTIDAICHLCSRCILLRDGEIQKIGDTAEVVAAYLGTTEEHDRVIDFPPTAGDATFRQAGLYDREGCPSNRFDANTPILLKCSVVVGRPIPGLQLSFAVLNFKGEQVFYSTISMADPAISIEAPGLHHIAATMPPRLLLPGPYFVNLALHTPHIQLYDFRGQSLHFKIIGAAEGYHGFSSEELGHVYADVKWQRSEEDRKPTPIANMDAALASTLTR
jgi:lipopolysaccharide transport system ATP-binding protein